VNDFMPLAQLVLGALSLPLVATLGGWLISRLSAERRLLAQVERLAHIYPSIPESLAKAEYAERVTAAVVALNTRLDPLFKVERKRKRLVVLWVLSAIVILVTIATTTHSPTEPLTSLAGLILGAVVVFAFWLIERDTRRQRAVLRSAVTNIRDDPMPD